MSHWGLAMAEGDDIRAHYVGEATLDELWAEIAGRVHCGLLVYDRAAERAGPDIAHTVWWAGSATAGLGLAVSAQVILTQNIHDAPNMMQEGPA